MSRRQPFFALSTIVVILAGGPWLAAGWAQDAKSPAPEKLLPADAVLYVGWDGIDAHRAAWEKTAAHEALVTSGLAEALGQFVGFAAMQGGGPQFPAIAAGLQKLYASGFQLAVGVPNSGDGPPAPQATIVIPGGATAVPEMIKGLLASMPAASLETEKVGTRLVTRAQLPEFPSVEIGWWAEGKHLVVTIGMGAIDTALNTAAGKAPSLESSPILKKYRAKAGDNVPFTAWIDLAQVRKLVGGIPVGEPGGAGPPATVSDVLKSLGLDRIGPLAMRVGFKDRALWTETTLEAPSPRQGLLAWETKPLSLDELPPLPAATDGFYATRLNTSGASEGLAKMAAELVRHFGGNNAPPFDALYENFQRQIGLDFQTDLFDALGEVVVVYGDTRQGVLGLGSGLAISVKDAKTLRATLDRLTGLFVQGVGLPIGIQASKRSGRVITHVAFPGLPVITPAWAVDDKWLIIGLAPQTVDAFLHRLDGKLERWAPPAEVKTALAQLPAKFTSLTYSDPRDGYRMVLSATPLLTSWVSMGIGGPMGGQAPIPPGDLPPAEVVTQPLFPNVSVCSITDQEIRWTSRTSLQAIPFLGGAGIGSAGSSAPILAALLLPAVGQAREAARRSQSKNNLKQFGLALHNYHDVYNTFPAGTHDNDQLKPEQRLSWQVDILPFVDQAPLYNQVAFDKPWDDDANLGILKAQIPMYLNPQLTIDRNGKVAHTHYVGIGGLGEDGPLLEVDNPKAGFFGYNRACSLRDITDGSSNTMAVSEAGKDFGGWGVGGRSTVRALTKKPYINGPDGLGGPFRGGMHVLFADGHVRFISENINPDLLEKLTTIAGGEPVDNF